MITSPFSPPNVFGNLSARAGSPTAKASVAPARYGPRRRLAAAPTGMPMIALTAVAAASAGAGDHPSFPIRSATV